MSPSDDDDNNNKKKPAANPPPVIDLLDSSSSEVEDPEYDPEANTANNRKKAPANKPLNLLDSSSSEEEDAEYDPEENTANQKKAHANKLLNNPYRKTATKQSAKAATAPKRNQSKRRKKPPGAQNSGTAGNKPLQAGLVFEEDVKASSSSASVDDEGAVTAESYAQQQEERKSAGKRALLYHDPDFATIPSSIEGQNKKDVVKCRCRGSLAAKLSYRERRGGGTAVHPYYHCANNKCNYFKWAFQAEKMQWYRFGTHTGHSIVGAAGFSANDLSQGRVGDCWFLSALAVVAERSDLIMRLFANGRFTDQNEYGVVQVNLFLDGYWKTVTMDNFLPCLIGDDASESQLQQVLEASRFGGGVGRTLKDGAVVVEETENTASSAPSSKYDPYALADSCRDVLRNTHEFLEKDQARRIGRITGRNSSSPRILQRPVTSDDLAYSKAKLNQLWVPFLEKAYAKSHGCYQAISGGHIAEAFLDLTGAPTLVYNFDSKDFHPRSFWSKLLQYRRQRLPLGCGTSSSAAGIIGMHAYSILDVKEVKNVSYRFFQETGVAHGNVSGFTEFDGVVRLLQIRNPHGKGEWKREFSDNSPVWEKLMQHQDQSGGSYSPGIQRSMKNDGTFWIDYDNFLMGFSNVDVVLAFLGNHAKSFPSNFPAKKSNHRCARAFEVSLLDEQPGMESRDTVELYIMGLQKTRRGARSGRSDRRVSYKVCDLGMLVGENHDAMGSVFDGDDDENRDNITFRTVKGQMFGFSRNGHYRLVLDRKKNKRVVVMPISFGHPAATDKELSFVLRFVSDAPLLIRELPNAPRMDSAIQQFCLSRHGPQSKQKIQKVLQEDQLHRMVQVNCLGNGGGIVFLYLCINEGALRKQGLDKSGVSFSVEASCRGMSCRTEEGLLQHETVAKGKKFEAAWRRYKAEFIGETKSRLLLVLYQSGQDTEFGAINCKRIATKPRGCPPEQSTLEDFLHKSKPGAMTAQDPKYNKRGIFNGVDGTEAFELSGNKANWSAAAAFGGIVCYQGGSDEELERALAISRGDLELQQALERRSQGASRNQDSSNFDTDLQRALELSTAEAVGSGGKALEQSAAASKNPSYADPSLSYDDALSKAVQLSKKESFKPDRSKAADADVVDLTEEDNVAAKRRKTDDEVVVLDDDTKEPGEEKKDIVAAKRKKTDDDEVIVLDDGAKEPGEEKKEEKPVGLAEKRRLAAEAAAKRFKTS